MSGKGYHYPVDFNSNGTKIIIGKYNSASHSQLFEVTHIDKSRPRCFAT